jgi:hypothetical protein
MFAHAVSTQAMLFVNLVTSFLKSSQSDNFFPSGINPTDSYVESDLFLKVIT